MMDLEKEDDVPSSPAMSPFGLNLTLPYYVDNQLFEAD